MSILSFFPPSCSHTSSLVLPLYPTSTDAALAPLVRHMTYCTYTHTVANTNSRKAVVKVLMLTSSILVSPSIMSTSTVVPRWVALSLYMLYCHWWLTMRTLVCSLSFYSGARPCHRVSTSLYLHSIPTLSDISSRLFRRRRRRRKRTRYPRRWYNWLKDLWCRQVSQPHRCQGPRLLWFWFNVRCRRRCSLGCFFCFQGSRIRRCKKRYPQGFSRSE